MTERCPVGQRRKPTVCRRRDRRRYGVTVASDDELAASTETSVVDALDDEGATVVVGLDVVGGVVSGAVVVVLVVEVVVEVEVVVSDAAVVIVSGAAVVVVVGSGTVVGATQSGSVQSKIMGCAP